MLSVKVDRNPILSIRDLVNRGPTLLLYVQLTFSFSGLDSVPGLRKSNKQFSCVFESKLVKTEVSYAQMYLLSLVYSIGVTLDRANSTLPSNTHILNCNKQ